jgi:FG-GAP repeat
MPVWLLALVCVGAASMLGVGPLSSRAVAAPEGMLEESELTGGETEEGAAAFGNSVALAADGQMALVGGPFDGGGVGAAWVFVRKEGAWTQVAKLTAGSEEGGAGHFGREVALSADGTTALVGAPGDRGGVGAAWVFRLTEGAWSRVARLAPGDEQGVGHFGRGLALSGDGHTALIGAPREGAAKTGGVWTFTSSGEGWTPGTRLLDGEADAEARFGWSLALSFDGSTALIGGSADDEGEGAAWIFERTGGGEGGWEQQGGKLAGAEELGHGQFGGSVALSPDGSTALVAAPQDSEGLGAAWVFVREGSQWSAQGGKLVSKIGSREQDFGSGVALSGNGDRALIGEATAKGRFGGRTGGAWMFGRSGETWTRLGFFLSDKEQPGEQFGRDVAIASDGETSLIGALGNEAETDEGRVGAAWVFVGPPLLKEPPTEEEEEQQQQATGGTSSSSSLGQSPNSQVLAVSQTHAASCGLRLVSSRLSVDHRGRAAVRLRSTGIGRCTGKVTLSIAKRVRRGSAKRARIRKVSIGVGGFTLVAGHNGTVRLKLTRTGRSLLLAGHGKLTASLRLQRTTPAPAQARSATAHLVLEKPKKSVKPKQ